MGGGGDPVLAEPRRIKTTYSKGKGASVNEARSRHPPLAVGVGSPLMTLLVMFSLYKDCR